MVKSPHYGTMTTAKSPTYVRPPPPPAAYNTIQYNFILLRYPHTTKAVSRWGIGKHITLQ